MDTSRANDAPPEPAAFPTIALADATGATRKVPRFDTPEAVMAWRSQTPRGDAEALCLELHEEAGEPLQVRFLVSSFAKFASGGTAIVIIMLLVRGGKGMLMSIALVGIIALVGTIASLPTQWLKRRLHAQRAQVRRTLQRGWCPWCAAPCTAHDDHKPVPCTACPGQWWRPIATSLGTPPKVAQAKLRESVLASSIAQGAFIALFGFCAAYLLAGPIDLRQILLASVMALLVIGLAYGAGIWSDALPWVIAICAAAPGVVLGTLRIVSSLVQGNTPTTSGGLMLAMGLLLGLVCAPMAMWGREERAKKQRAGLLVCSECGYPRRPKNPHARCPECGHLPMPGPTS